MCVPPLRRKLSRPIVGAGTRRQSDIELAYIRKSLCWVLFEAARNHIRKVRRYARSQTIEARNLFVALGEQQLDHRPAFKW
jgi:hypothetical protein